MKLLPNEPVPPVTRMLEPCRTDTLVDLSSGLTGRRQRGPGSAVSWARSHPRGCHRMPVLPCASSSTATAAPTSGLGTSSARRRSPRRRCAAATRSSCTARSRVHWSPTGCGRSASHGHRTPTRRVRRRAPGHLRAVRRRAGGAIRRRRAREQRRGRRPSVAGRQTSSSTRTSGPRAPHVRAVRCWRAARDGRRCGAVGGRSGRFGPGARRGASRPGGAGWHRRPRRHRRAARRAGRHRPPAAGHRRRPAGRRSRPARSRARPRTSTSTWWRRSPTSPT